MKVVFVGVHFKEGFGALDSRTPTGRVIDQIVDSLEVARVEVECEKTNLFPVNHLPHGEERENLFDEFPFEETDLYVGLGNIVCDNLSRIDNCNLIAVYHPGHPIRRGEVDQYVERVVEKIIQSLN